MCNFLFVMQVFLSTKNCRSLASISLLVRASLIICFSSLTGGISCVEESFAKFDHAPSSKVSLLINFENSLQPLMLGEVICRSGWMKGPKFPEKFAIFLHFSLVFAVIKLSRGVDIFFQSAMGNRSLSSEGGSMLKFASTRLSRGIYW